VVLISLNEGKDYQKCGAEIRLFTMRGQQKN